MDDVDARLDVGEGVGGGEDGFALVLLVQVPVRPSVQGEGGAVDEAPQVVVLVEVGDAVLHLVGVEVGLHVRDLDEGLQHGCVLRELGFVELENATASPLTHLIWVQLALVHWV